MKSDYNDKKAARLERYETLAAKNEQLAKDKAKYASEIAACIPMGQPILVGHHSEKRHRNTLDKIHNTFGASVKADEKAAYYRDKADSLLNGTAISSDDPDAVDKLEEKLETLMATQQLYRSINVIVRNKKMEALGKIEALQALGLSNDTANKLLLPGHCCGAGIAHYKLANNSANIRRIKQRIEYLKKLQAIVYQEVEINGVKLVVDPDENRVMVYFKGKPNDSIRCEMRANAFRWAPTKGAWVRQLSQYAIDRVKAILNKIPELK